MVTTHLSGISMTVDQSGTRVARDARWSSVRAAAQDGDCAGYNTLLRDILPQIRAVSRAHLRGAADVDDAMQDTLLSLHALRRTYDPARPFKPWLNSIAERRAIERLRKLDRPTGRESIIDDLPEGVGATQAVGTARPGWRRRNCIGRWQLCRPASARRYYWPNCRNAPEGGRGVERHDGGRPEGCHAPGSRSVAWPVGASDEQRRPHRAAKRPYRARALPGATLAGCTVVARHGCRVAGGRRRHLWLPARY